MTNETNERPSNVTFINSIDQSQVLKSANREIVGEIEIIEMNTAPVVHTVAANSEPIFILLSLLITSNSRIRK